MSITISAQQTQDLHVQDTFQVFVELNYAVYSGADWLGSMQSVLTLDGTGIKYVSHEVVKEVESSDETSSFDEDGGSVILTTADSYDYISNMVIKYTLVGVKSGTYSLTVTGVSLDPWGENGESESETISVTIGRVIEPAVTVHVPSVLRTTCPICGVKILTDPLTWQEHMEYVHGAVTSWDFPPQVSGGDYKCYGCGRQFYTEAEVETHLYEAHRARVV